MHRVPEQGYRKGAHKEGRGNGDVQGREVSSQPGRARVRRQVLRSGGGTSRGFFKVFSRFFQGIPIDGRYVGSLVYGGMSGAFSRYTGEVFGTYGIIKVIYGIVQVMYNQDHLQGVQVNLQGIIKVIGYFRISLPCWQRAADRQDTPTWAPRPGYTL